MCDSLQSYESLLVAQFFCEFLRLLRDRSSILPGEGVEDIWEGVPKFCPLRGSFCDLFLFNIELELIMELDSSIISNCKSSTCVGTELPLCVKIKNLKLVFTHDL